MQRLAQSVQRAKLEKTKCYSLCDDLATNKVPRSLVFQVLSKSLFSLLTAPSTWTDHLKESGEQMVGTNTKVTILLEICFPYRANTLVNRRHFDVNPVDIFETLLHSCTTQRCRGMRLQGTRKTKLGNNSVEYYSFFPVETEKEPPLGIPN